ncbi:MAG: hypothetical protein ONB30_03565 [candidate division KSB1 bacterium]|nr:hypothetical protein [candidate division KSB1 bacterium]
MEGKNAEAWRRTYFGVKLLKVWGLSLFALGLLALCSWIVLLVLLFQAEDKAVALYVCGGILVFVLLLCGVGLVLPMLYLSKMLSEE